MVLKNQLANALVTMLAGDLNQSKDGDLRQYLDPIKHALSMESPTTHATNNS